MKKGAREERDKVTSKLGASGFVAQYQIQIYHRFIILLSPQCKIIIHFGWDSGLDLVACLSFSSTRIACALRRPTCVNDFEETTRLLDCAPPKVFRQKFLRRPPLGHPSRRRDLSPVSWLIRSWPARWSRMHHLQRRRTMHPDITDGYVLEKLS